MDVELILADDDKREVFDDRGNERMRVRRVRNVGKIGVICVIKSYKREDRLKLVFQFLKKQSNANRLTSSPTHRTPTLTNLPPKILPTSCSTILNVSTSTLFVVDNMNVLSDGGREDKNLTIEVGKRGIPSERDEVS